MSDLNELDGCDLNELDGCDLDFTVDADADETAELRALFPQGDDTPDVEAKAAEWREVLAGA